MNETANIGFTKYATRMEAVRVIMIVMGRKDMNLPAMPGMNTRGKNGAIVFGDHSTDNFVAL